MWWSCINKNHYLAKSQVSEKNEILRRIIFSSSFIFFLYFRWKISIFAEIHYTFPLFFTKNTFFVYFQLRCHSLKSNKSVKKLNADIGWATNCGGLLFRLNVAWIFPYTRWLEIQYRCIGTNETFNRL